MSSASAIFTGSSQFASSLSQVIQRDVQFASLPMQQMQNELTAIQGRQTAAQTLDTDFVNLQAAVKAVQAAITGTQAVEASTSDSSIVSVALSGTPTPGSYSIKIGDTGAYANSMSNDGLKTVSDPDSQNIGDATSYTLAVGTSTYTITPTGNTLSALEQALNLSGQVQATLVNLGSSVSPDYRLSLEGTQLGNLPIQLTANNGSNPGQTLMTAQTPPGGPATYQVNGEPSTPIQSNSPVVTISPGVSVNLLGKGTAAITVSPSTTALSAAFSNLASAYNTAVSDVSKNRGQNGGALAGDSLLTSLTQALNSIVGYTAGNGGIASLTSLGFSFDQSGVLSFDPTAFAAAVSGNSTQLASFLGSSTGGGFLQAATNQLNGVLDATTGLLPQDLNLLSSQITAENQDISDQQTKINTLQQNLTQQMAMADAAISTLEQQQTYMQQYFQQMQITALASAGL